MAGIREAVHPIMHRLRVGLKTLAYSSVARDRWQQPDRVIAELELRAGGRVADLGSGLGYFTLPLARAVGPSGVVYAVDTDTDLLATVSKKALRRGLRNIVTVLASSDDPRLPEAVDLIFLANAYHHLPDPAGYVTNLARALRPGGRVAVIEARPRGLLRIFWHWHTTEAETIRSTFAAAGYTRVGDHDFLPRQSFQLFAPATE